MASPRRAQPRTRREKIVGVIAGVGVMALIAGAVLSDGYTRLLNLVVDRYTHPKVEVNSFPSPFQEQKPFEGVMLPGTPDEVQKPPGPDDDAIRSWAASRGGMDSKRTVVSLSLTSPDKAVVVQSIKLDVLDRKPALVGVYVPVCGGGSFWRRAYYANLDDESLTPDKATGEEVWDFPLSLGPDDTYVVDIVGEANTSLVEWEIEIHYVSEGVEQVAVLDDGGEPFRTTGWSAATHTWRCDPPDGGSWTPGPPM